MSALPASLSGYTETKLIDPFEIFIGPVYETGPKGARRFALIVDKRHVNLRGVLHGGMFMTFADLAMGQAVWDACDYASVVTLNMQSQFLRSVREGDIVEVLPVVTRNGSIVFIRGDFQVDGETVYSCASLWKIVGKD
jgi:uncharacterized protein (TIGR00369 family)